MKTTATTTDALAEDSRRVQGTKDDDGGSNGSTTGLVDWKRQQSFDFTCFQVTNSNTVSYLSRGCLVLIFFHRIPFFWFAA